MSADAPRRAPGAPGIDPRWTTSAKSAVGTARGGRARVWFTASHGILNECYFPEVDTANTRDAGFLVSDDHGFFSEEKRHATHTVSWLEPGVPAYRFVNRCRAGRYELRKRTCTATAHDAVLQAVEFVPLVGTLADYRLTFLLGAHLGNHGGGNTAWVADWKGTPLLVAVRDGLALAIASTAPWLVRSVGYAGPHDAWHDVRAHGRITAPYDLAEDGNVSLAGTVDTVACDGRFTLAIGFGTTWEAAALQARSALLDPYEAAEARYAAPWRAFQATLPDLHPEPAAEGAPLLHRTSLAVIASHGSRVDVGGMIASLSVPWGSTKGDGDLGGYHLVWPRDMVNSAGALLAAGAIVEARAALRYLAVTQEGDGHWPQNMWLDGRAYWQGIQLDESAFPILLADLARRHGAITPADDPWVWPMVRRAAAFLVRTGPVTEQDRWEEDAGFSPFTLAVCIAALCVAAEEADRHGEAAIATWLRETADAWNAHVERWTWVEDTPLARLAGVRGHYVRIGSADADAAAGPARGRLVLRNRAPDESEVEASAIVATDALALVRYGLRAPDDPRILDTVRVIDAVLRTETRSGPVWHRYNGDGYGEHADGSAYDGTGIGRGWPLLGGERAHYELAAGRVAEAERLAAVLRAQAGDGGMLPEQLWDAADLPALELFDGRPAGSAMPLVWAHAEYVKLLRSLRDGVPFDRPPAALARYGGGPVRPRVASWRLALPCRAIAPGRTLRIELAAPATVRWSVDGWATVHDDATTDPGLGVHACTLPTDGLAVGAAIDFTLRWADGERWEGRDFRVQVGAETGEGDAGDP